MRASIHFEDRDGEILTRVDFSGPYNDLFPSHRIASTVLGFLDANAKEKTFIAEPTETDDEIIRATGQEIARHG
jgi:hypothetical protein